MPRADGRANLHAVQHMNQHKANEAEWAEILTRLDSVLGLCRSLGLEEQVAVSRFMEYRQRLALLNEAFRREGVEGPRRLYDLDRLAQVVAITEAAELASLEPFLSMSNPVHLRPKLRDVLGGPPLPDEEDGNSNHARNILFELNLAAKLFAGGVVPTVGDRPDLQCEIASKAVLFECKRVLSERAARKRIGEAWDVLCDEAPKAGPEARGVVALSVTKLVNPGDQIFSASNEADAHSGLDRLLRAITDKLSNAWVRTGTRVVGILFHVVTPAFLEDRKVLALQQRTHGLNVVPRGTPDFALFTALLNYLKEARE